MVKGEKRRDGLKKVTAKSWQDTFIAYKDRRIGAIFLLGLSSGLPLSLVLGTLGIWLAREGIDKTTVGLFSAVTLPYTLKFVWSPVLDRIPIPILTDIIGQRRSWAVVSQVLLMVTISAMGLTDPTETPTLMAIFALLVSLCSASQDIVIDAYRVELLEEEKIGAGASTVVLGYRIGLLISGAGALYLAEELNWDIVYFIMAALMFIGFATILLNREPNKDTSSEILLDEKRTHDYLKKRPNLSGNRALFVVWFHGAVIGPFVDFMTRPQWLVILLFIVFYKLGDSMAGVMTGYFMVELGFSNSEIAYVGKVFGFVATMVGFAVGGWIIVQLGMLWALWICGIVQMVSNLMFVIQAIVGYDTQMLAVAVGIENLAGGMGTAALVAYLSGLCNLAYTATQYALLSAVAALGRTFLAAPAGRLAEDLDWVSFFSITTLAAIPGLGLLLWLTISKRKRERENKDVPRTLAP